MLTPGMLRNMTVVAKIKSHPSSTTSGVRPTPQDAFDVTVSPLDAVEPYLTERLQLEAPLNARQTYTYTDKKIEQGMYLSISGREYPIKGVAPYPENDSSGMIFYQLIVEDLVSR